MSRFLRDPEVSLMLSIAANPTYAKGGLFTPRQVCCGNQECLWALIGLMALGLVKVRRYDGGSSRYCLTAEGLKMIGTYRPGLAAATQHEQCVEENS